MKNQTQFLLSSSFIKAKRSFAAFIFLLLGTFHFPLIAQITTYTYYDAYTQGDPPNGDGMASDACSFANCTINSPYIEANINLSQVGCNPLNLGEGNPGADFDFLITINHVGYPVQNFLGHEIPYGFQYTLEGSGNNTSVNYEATQGSTVESGYMDLNSQFLSVDLANYHIMTLPHALASFHLQVSAYINANGDNDYFHIPNMLKIIVPSQFYLENSLTSPATVAIGSYTYELEERCAEDIYIEENIELGSYMYSAANDLFVDGTVKNATNVTFSAGNSILFGPGFSVEAGSSMTTQTYTGCTNP